MVWQVSVTLPAYVAKFDGETRLPIEATSHHTKRSSGTLHTKHWAHSSAAVVDVKSSHAPAKSNSYMGLPISALAGSLFSTGRPEMGSRVRPLLLTALDFGALKNRLPVRELSVASMMAVNRPMMMGIEKKASRSAAASGPLKHVFSTHLRTQESATELGPMRHTCVACGCKSVGHYSSCSFQLLGLK